MQRIIAYIYRYKEDKDGKLTRCGNTGFCRVEITDETCVVTICFKDICRQSGEGNIHGLVFEKGRCDTACCYQIKKHIGTGKIVEGQMNAKVEAGGTDGILIECGTNKYIVMWQKTVDTICLTREKEDKVGADQKVLHQLKEAEVQKKVESQEPEIMCEESKETIEKNKEISNKNTTTESVNDKMLERAYNRMCKVRMIIDDHVCQVIKIKPQEIIMLPRSYWRLANNCFLMDMYYTYKHLLFFKYDGDYAVGVPGKGGTGEEAYAMRFGFYERVTGGDYGKGTENRTYWLMRLR